MEVILIRIAWISMCKNLDDHLVVLFLEKIITEKKWIFLQTFQYVKGKEW